MIDSLAEGLIDKDQFTSRVARTKARIAELDAKIASQAAQDEQRAHVRAVMSRLYSIIGSPPVSAERRRLGHEA